MDIRTPVGLLLASAAVLVASLRQSWRNDRGTQALEHDLAEFLVQHLPPEMRPDDVRLVTEIPRSFLNKMLRREVRLMLEAMPPRSSAAHTARAEPVAGSRATAARAEAMASAHP